jgi:ankyrin repeat protein
MRKNIVLLLLMIVLSNSCAKIQNKAPGSIFEDENILRLIDNNDTSGFQVLVDSGYDVNTVLQDGTYSGVTPLIQAIKSGNIEMVRLLLQNNADIELCTSDGSPLAIAAGASRFEIVKLLLDNGADINNYYRFFDKRAIGTSAIFNAAIHFNFEMYDYLVEQGADVNGGSFIEGENALMGVLLNFSDRNQTRSQLLRMVINLIEDGINVNHTVWYGNALTIAAGNNDIEIMKILLEHGADLNITIEEQGSSTYDYLLTVASSEMIKLMNQYYQK